MKVKEPSLEALARGKTVYEPARSALPDTVVIEETSCLLSSASRSAQHSCDEAVLASLKLSA